ncbi:MAG: endo-1,4-beta-xylanase [Lachnospiraceae bacterium]|nr:endo-1,4-beta-xylanase [Lachnospiraceae bacterium]
MALDHRKATKKVLITDASGRPMANAKLSLKQTQHKFLFGCGAFDFMPYLLSMNADEVPLNRPERFRLDPELLKKKIDQWLAVYNYGTLPFYWGMFEHEEGRPNTENMLKTARFMKEKGITVKGHPLCWHTVCADWLLKYDIDTIYEKQMNRISREVTDFKGVIDIWDAINEVVIMPIFDKYDNAVTRLCNKYGRVGLIKRVFDQAKAANPDAMLLINDFNTSISYEILIDGCLNAGVPISAIGIQSHQHQGYWGAKKVEEVLKRYEHFGLPIHFTENTLISGDLMPAHIVDLNDWQVPEWPSTPEGEERQRREMEEMYRILFDHPLVEAVTGWDFTDGAWLGAPSGVLRKDGSAKPSYDMLKDLIRGEWWTDCEVTTDEAGYVTLTGFKGDYELSDGTKKAAISLRESSDAAETVVL